jgi:hypothetical protein
MTVKYGEMENLVTSVISIDQYKPKIGEANETVVVAFEVMSEQPAKDLSNLIETDVVESLDVDISQGPNDDGKYMVFVEFERNNKLHESILDIMKVVNNVTGIKEWQFNFYKGATALELNEDNLRNSIVDSPEQYVLKYKTVEDTNESINRIKLLAGVKI